MTLAQLTLELGLRLDGARGLGRVAAAAVRAVRKLQVQLHDPPVVYHIGRIALQLRLSHQLPYYRRRFPQYSSNIGRIGAAIQQKYPDMSLIDIGANVGDTVAIVRELAHFPILCIEGSQTYLPSLHLNVGDLADVEIEAAYVGGESGTVAASVRTGDGTGYLAIGDSDIATVQLRSLDEVVKRHPRFASSKLVKSDTDGMDCQILAGAASYLATVRPVLFFEYDPDLTARAGASAVQVFDVLRAAGYRHALVYENIGDLILLLDLEDNRLVADLDGFFTGHDGLRYADICAFHASDSDLAQSLREQELDFFQKLRQRPKR